MKESLVDQIARAVLYEGYILYPYRPTSVKNQQRWTFGGIYPRAFSESQNGSDAWWMQTQCLLKGIDQAKLRLSVRFLHLMDRKVEDANLRRVKSLEAGEKCYHAWQEAVERSVDLAEIGLGDLLKERKRQRFHFTREKTIEELKQEGKLAGRLVREQQQVDGMVEVSAEQRAEGVYQLTAKVWNETEMGADGDRDEALMRSLVSTHMILEVAGGVLISQTDPPEELKELAGRCANVGCWPVLVGEAGATDTLLVSPIILYDYPQIAPESPGDLFDGCEIDEILTLRIMTMTDDEKRQATMIDPRAAEMMARTEALAREQLMNLHGALRGVDGPMMGGG